MASTISLMSGKNTGISVLILGEPIMRRNTCIMIQNKGDVF
jgi:hypothetical protein